MKPLIIGIAGGTGSGKTTVANRIYESLKGRFKTSSFKREEANKLRSSLSL